MIPERGQEPRMLKHLNNHHDNHPLSTLRWLALIASLGVIHKAHAAPQKIILIRHAEKNIPQSISQNINPRGLVRSINLAHMIPGCFGKPSQIFVFPFKPDHYDTEQREYQTAVPVASALEVDIDFLIPPNHNSIDAGSELRKLNSDSHPLVLVVWSHHRMPDLAKGLGWPHMKKIANDEFDLLFEFEYSSGESTPKVTKFQQSQLNAKQCAQRPSPLPFGPFYKLKK